MSDFAVDQLLKIDEKTYRQNFSSSDFGVLLAEQVAQSNHLIGQPTRITEGSSLVFSVGNLFLKLTPPFLGDALSAEISATKYIGNQLTFQIPKIVSNGEIGGWKFVITESVPGVPAKNVFKTMTPEDLIEFAKDIGQIAKSFRNLNTLGFERDFGPWGSYLALQLRDQKRIHIERGNSEDWAEKISQYVKKNKGLLANFSQPKFIHADLNHEHLMMEKRDLRWRVTGVIDFADAMNAPLEMEFIIPILCFFKGNAKAQIELVRASGLELASLSNNYSELMMMLTLQNRFIAFHDWFGREIRSGSKSIEEIAAAVFPQI